MLESTPKKWGIPNYFTFGVKLLKKFSQPLAFSSRQGWARGLLVEHILNFSPESENFYFLLMYYLEAFYL